MHRYLKFGIPVVAILAALLWLGFSSTNQNQGYFFKIPEVKQMGEQARAKQLRVNGYVKEGSIMHAGHGTTFTLVENQGMKDPGDSLAVVYTGRDPLPDTFREHASALADGSLGADGIFHANKIQGKLRVLNIAELKQLGDQARAKTLRVTGYIQEGSIEHLGSVTTFMLVENQGTTDLGDRLRVTYAGRDPLPDALRKHFATLALGNLGADGVLHAYRIQPKLR